MKTKLYSAILFITFLANGPSCGKKPEYEPPPFRPNANLHKLTLLLDKTGSSSVDETPRFAGSLKQALNASEEPWEIEVVGIGANGRGPWDAGKEQVKIEGAPIYQFDVEAVKKFYQKKCWGKNTCFDEKIKYAEDITKSKYEEVRSKYDSRKKEAVAKLIEAIVNPPMAEPVCTDVQEMAERAMQSQGSVIWITDADHNCRSTFTGLTLKETILVGLAPLKNEEPGEFIKRLRAMSQKLDTEKVKPAAMLDADAIQSFLSVSGEQLLAQGGAK